MLFAPFIEKLSRHRLSADSAAVAAPLVDDAGLRELALLARSLPRSWLDGARSAAHPLSGEAPSAHRGRGLEFEENRVYRAGDEPRAMNWRLYARTGTPYVKVFAEERRTPVFIVVDRRAAMRFATRRRLKATLAASIGVCLALRARQEARPVGGLLLNRTVEWFAPAFGEAPVHGLVRAMVAPCPPLDFDDDRPALGDCVRMLSARLPAGSFILLASDFADLDPAADAPALQRLAAQHTVRAIQVLDPVERRLPAAGDFLVEDGPARHALRIAARDAAQRALYADACGQRQARVAACFDRCGIPFSSCTTQDELDACLGCLG